MKKIIQVFIGNILILLIFFCYLFVFFKIRVLSEIDYSIYIFYLDGLNRMFLPLMPFILFAILSIFFFLKFKDIHIFPKITAFIFIIAISIISWFIFLEETFNPKEINSGCSHSGGWICADNFFKMTPLESLILSIILGIVLSSLVYIYTLFISYIFSQIKPSFKLK